MDNRKIGVFDSGIGGLTVVRSLFDVLPRERVVYFGDSLNVPYGSRGKADIARLASGIIRFLKDQNVKAIVCACNTVSSLCVDKLRGTAGVPIVDVLTPGSIAAARAAKKGVGVIATHNTVVSGAHERVIRGENPALAVYARECPLLVPIAEEGIGETEVAYAAARHYLSAFDGEKIDCVLMGCTHYPLLENALRAATGLPLLDPAVYAALEMKRLLEETGSLADEKRSDSGDPSVLEHDFFTSGDAAVFEKQLRRVLGTAFSCLSRPLSND